MHEYSDEWNNNDQGVRAMQQPGRVEGSGTRLVRIERLRTTVSRPGLAFSVPHKPPHRLTEPRFPPPAAVPPKPGHEPSSDFFCPQLFLACHGVVRLWWYVAKDCSKACISSRFLAVKGQTARKLQAEAKVQKLGGRDFLHCSRNEFQRASIAYCCANVLNGPLTALSLSIP